MRIAAFVAGMAVILAQPAPASELPNGSIDAMVDLAMRESLILTRLWRVVTEDADLRAEARRVGFGQGCRALVDTRRDVDARYRQILIPEAVKAIQAAVPEAALAADPVLSFSGGAIAPYREKVIAQLSRIAGAKLDAADAEMRAGFLARTRPLPAAADPADNTVWPQSDFSAMVGIDNAYDLTKAVPFGFACAELQMRYEG